jgi:hypothetical protein
MLGLVVQRPLINIQRVSLTPPMSLPPASALYACVCCGLMICTSYMMLWVLAFLPGAPASISAGLGPFHEMCLACALGFMSPSVHSWHQRESIDVVSAQVEEKLGSAEWAGAWVSSTPWSATDNDQLNQPANFPLHPHCMTSN